MNVVLKYQSSLFVPSYWWICMYVWCYVISYEQNGELRTYQDIAHETFEYPVSESEGVKLGIQNVTVIRYWPRLQHIYAWCYVISYEQNGQLRTYQDIAHWTFEYPVSEIRSARCEIRNWKRDCELVLASSSTHWGQNENLACLILHSGC